MGRNGWDFTSCKTAVSLGPRRRCRSQAVCSLQAWGLPLCAHADSRKQANILSVVLICIQVSTIMTATLSIRIDSETKKRLEALAKRSRRSKSFLAAEAIAAYVDSEDWQLAEIQPGIADLESGDEVSHEHVAKWMRTWGKHKESKPPR